MGSTWIKIRLSNAGKIIVTLSKPVIAPSRDTNTDRINIANHPFVIAFGRIIITCERGKGQGGA